VFFVRVSHYCVAVFCVVCFFLGFLTFVAFFLQYKIKENPEKANNTKYSNTMNRDTYNPLIYNNAMG